MWQWLAQGGKEGRGGLRKGPSYHLAGYLGQQSRGVVTFVLGHEDEKAAQAEEE